MPTADPSHKPCSTPTLGLVIWTLEKMAWDDADVDLMSHQTGTRGSCHLAVGTTRPQEQLEAQPLPLRAMSQRSRASTTTPRDKVEEGQVR